jgi:hypothetical protein
MKKHWQCIWALAALLALSMVAVGTTWAAQPAETRKEIENLKRRIEMLEAQAAEQEGAAEKSLEEEGAERALSLSGLADHITLHGLIELEAAYSKPRGGDESSDLTLATVELGAEIQVTDYLGGEIVLLWEENETEPIDVDVAVVNLTYPHPLFGVTAGFVGGRMYVPFGKFNSFMVTDPLTLDLGETNQSAGLLTLEGAHWILQAGAFSGETDTRNDNEAIDGWVAALEVTPLESLSFGVSLISDLAESDIALVEDEDLYDESVLGGAAFVSWTMGPLGLEAEYVTALDSFDPALVGLTDLTGDRPSAWNLELGWTFAEHWQAALRYEQAEDFQDDVTRFGGVLSRGLFDHAVLAVEYLHSDAKGPEGDPEHTVTAQLAVEF